MSTVEPVTFSTPDQAQAEWLPAWFVPRMMAGNGGVALLLAGGTVVPIERIDRVHRACDGSVWLDVLLTLPADGARSSQQPLGATEPEATLNAAYVVAAFVSGRFDPRSSWDGGSIGISSEVRF